MRTISFRKLREFYEKNKMAEKPLRTWFKMINDKDYNSFSDLREMFPSADVVGKLTIFNIAGNKYRLIASIHYNTKVVFVRYILTHKEYDKETWKDK